MRIPSRDLFLPSIFAALVFLVGILAINVDIPDEFVQCEPATLSIANSRGNVSIYIRKNGARKAHVNVSLAIDAKNWTWDPVDFPANDNFTVLVTDRSPKKKTTLSSSYFQSMIAPSPNNNNSCLPKKYRGDKKKDEEDGQDGDGKDIGEHDPSFGNGPDVSDGDSPHHKKSTTEIAIIAGILGGLMAALIGLSVVMCLRRRREHRKITASNVLDDHDGRPIVAHRIQDMQHTSSRHRVVTLFGPDGRAEGQAILSHEGDAGWSYMSHMVDGLESNTPIPTSPSARRHPSTGRRRVQTKRYDEEQKDGDLPSYRMSEYERKNLPKYETVQLGHKTQSSAPILMTRHDSQGSRLTFSPDTQETIADESFRRQALPRRSVSSRRSQFNSPSAISHHIDMEYDDESNGVIVFGGRNEGSDENHESRLPYAHSSGTSSRPTTNQSLLSQHGNAEASHAASTGIQHATSNLAHRRSRSEASLRR